MNFIDHKGERYSINSPNHCPHCHSKVTPQILWKDNFRNTEKNEILISSWRCPDFQCGQIFVVEYDYSKQEIQKMTIGLHRILHPQKFLNGTIVKANWPEVISNLRSGFSEVEIHSKFTDVYHQAIEAEAKGLNEIAGMGYRKAIEYLVKDLAAQNHPNEKDEIKKLFLGKVIERFFKGELQELLEKATWLGNDQSHYFKLFEEYDLEELKELILVIVADLDNEYRRRKYLAIESRKNKSI